MIVEAFRQKYRVVNCEKLELFVFIPSEGEWIRIFECPPDELPAEDIVGFPEVFARTGPEEITLWPTPHARYVVGEWRPELPA